MALTTRRAREIREAIKIYRWYKGGGIYFHLLGIYYSFCTDLQANTIKRLMDKEK